MADLFCGESGKWLASVPSVAIAQLTQPGKRDDDAKYWADHAQWRRAATNDALREFIKGYGTWDEGELAKATRLELRSYAIWLLACNHEATFG